MLGPKIVARSAKQHLQGLMPGQTSGLRLDGDTHNGPVLLGEPGSTDPKYHCSIYHMCRVIQSASIICTSNIWAVTSIFRLHIGTPGFIHIALVAG